MRLLYVTNIPSPYRVHFFDVLARIAEIELRVVYCAANESNREWKVPDLSHDAVFLPQRMLSIGRSRVYFQWEVVSQIRRFKPDAVITGGFTPTMLLAMLTVKLHGCKLGINSDAWKHTERNYSGFHIGLRKIIYPHIDFFFPISFKGRSNLVEEYGVEDGRIQVVPYVIDQSNFQDQSLANRTYDLIFSGQFIERKMPLFFANVAKTLGRSLQRKLSIVVLGSGPLKKDFLAALDDDYIEVHYPGFVSQKEVAEYFMKSKLFLFPTKSDGWGVVANEAAAAGVPVVISSFAGAAGDIVRHEVNGLVLDNNIQEWVAAAEKLLTDKELWHKYATSSVELNASFDAERVCERLSEFMRGRGA